MFTDQSIIHNKLSTSGFNEFYSQVATFQANVQPANGESTAMVQGVYGRTYNFYTTYTGVNIEDQLINGPKIYRVKAVKRYEYPPFNHDEIIAIEAEV